MSQNQNQAFEVNKYNFSRRVVDHRYPIDFFYNVNKNPWTPEWILASRNWLIGGITSKMAMLTSGIGLLALFVLPEIDAYVRRNREGVAQSPLTFQRGQFSQNYLRYYNDVFQDKGKWNNNFRCWQNDPLCARDF